ncbi:uncharacterized protein L203_103780 [Cryptococcus depauperatus CBS 7841]|uniref:Small ribosomal subunit protein uS13m n=1 Tax=Cryptococcus depauperatus CBS 7841 TaxID=1295531 RepID=A0A1E3IEK8_9TREE|nr:30S small subunit ribosomal protein S13 [Cryptococcus depauperatus CBS 7841]
MHLLGRNLPDHKPLKIALLTFYGISHTLSARLLPRLGIHSEALVSQLTEPQLTALSAYLSSPSTTARPSDNPLELVPPGGLALKPIGHPAIVKSMRINNAKGKGKVDPLDELKIETEKKSAMQADIAHLRMIGTYRGKRHAAGYPVHGQRTQTNAKTAKKLNRVDRRNFGTFAAQFAWKSLCQQP